MRSQALVLGIMATMLTAGAASAQQMPRHWRGGGEWELLGEARVQGRRDVDVIQVGAREGRFRKVLFTVDNADMILVGFRVTFRGGEVTEQRVNARFREGARSQAFDLPGEARAIESIAIFARDLRGRGKPIVRVHGEKSRSAPAWGRWESLGQTSVDGRRDADTIHVGRREGRFRALQIAVHESDLRMFDIVVTFMNGETFRPGVRPFFREGSRSQVIDLPGDARAIRSVSFRYADLGRRDGRARVELLAR